MAVKIRLKRMGKIRAPFYRVVIMDSRTKRDGRAIEEIGKYHPTEEPSLIDIDGDRAQHWLAQGAQPTEAVEALLKVTGDWQKFKGEAGAEGTLKVKAPKTSKRELYEAALAAAGKTIDEGGAATTARKRAPKAEATTDASAPKAEAPKTEAAPVAEAPKADAAPEVEAAAPVEEAAAPEVEVAAPVEEAAAPEVEVAAPVEEAVAVEAADESSSTPAAFAAVADEAPEKALPAGAIVATEDGAAPEGHDVKGNGDSGLYHVPGSQWYDATVAEFWFASAADAEKAGFAPAGGAAKQQTEAADA